METTLFIDAVPHEQELIAVLSENIYKNYNDLCEAIVLFLDPDSEIWDHAGRRGKYFHGYRNKSILVDLYLLSIDGQGVLKCDFHFRKRFVDSLLKKKESFSKETQGYIDSCLECNKLGGGFWCEIRIDDKTLQDAIQIIKMLAGRKMANVDLR